MWITDTFNNREIAIAFWLLIFFSWAFVKTKAKSSVKSLIKQFLHYKILVPYLLAVCYSSVGLYILSLFNLWTPKQLKDTIIWCIITIISTMMTLTKARENKNYFRDAANENFKLSVIIGFVTGVYTFSLPVELFLIPIVAFIGGMQAFTEKKQEYGAVQKVLSTTVLLLGLWTIGFTIYQISVHIREFASFDTLRDFILSPFLALWFLPFLYIVSLYMTYETYFITMQFRIKDKKLLQFAKWQALLRFNVNLDGFERWKNRLFIGSVETKDDIVKSIKEIKRLQCVEKNPPIVNAELGWSPYTAKDFLLCKGISTRHYMQTYEDSWSASSEYIKLDDSFMNNTLRYYIEGIETIAKNLHLVLDIHELSKEKDAVQAFLESAKFLYHTATGSNLPKEICDAILKKKNRTTKVGNNKLIVKRDDWLNQDKYTLLLYIQHD